MEPTIQFPVVCRDLEAAGFDLWPHSIWQIFPLDTHDLATLQQRPVGPGTRPAG